MPLLRFELKNEYGLGDSRLYQGARKEEDPRNILGGFTVCGLVGILRQLGDLAEFAAVVFHDVHQQVITTAARGQKVLKRIQKIETMLPQFEKVVQEQKSHVHFAYVTGCDWHANIQIEQSELFASDLPEFMMDSYEGCRDPPRLHLLDKFDSAGAGACLKRYSDPSYIRRVMSSSKSVMAGGAHNGINVKGKKKQRSRGRNGLARSSVHMTLHGRSLNNSAQFAPVFTDELRFSVDDASISDTLSASSFRNELMHSSSDKRSGCLEPQYTSSSMSKELYDDDMSAVEAETKQNVDCIFSKYSKSSANDYVIQDSVHPQNSLPSTSISSHENTEIAKNGTMQCTSPKFSDDFSPSRSPDLARDQISEPTGQVDKDIDETNALISKVQTNSEYNIRQGVIVLNQVNYDVINCEVNTTPENHTVPTDVLSDTSPCRPQDSEFLLLTLETSNQHSDMTNTSKLDKHMEPTNDFVPKIKMKSENQTGPGAILLPHLNYYKIRGVSSPSIDGVGGDIVPFKPQNLDLLFSTIETSNTSNPQYEMSGTEMPNEKNYLLNTMKTVPTLRGGKILEQTSQLDKHMSATDAFDSEVQTNIEYQSGVMLLSNQNYDGLEGEINKLPRIPTSLDGVDVEVAYESYTSVKEELCALTFDHVHPVGSGSTAEYDSEVINNGIPVKIAVAIDGIPPKLSSSQESEGDTSVKNSTQNEVLRVHQTEVDEESAADSNSRLTEYQSSTEKLITASNIIDPDTETRVVACCSSSNDCASPILFNIITSNTADNTSYSTISSGSSSSRCLDAFSPRNVSENPDGNVSTQVSNTSVILPSNTSESLRKTSINIWTNGGLLGLEPSKPPYIGVPNAHCGDKIYDNRSSADSHPCILGNQSKSRNSFSEADKLNNVVTFPEKDDFTGKLSDKQSDSVLSRQHSEVSIQPPSFYNKEDIAHGFPERSVSSSLDLSGCQSPPLEHMKVSFQRMNNSDTSNLRLEFCNIRLDGNMGDVTFPSFQLLGDSIHPLMDSVSESEDDTFCRSCPYSSDDLLALYSESDAETWGEDEVHVQN